MLLRAPIAASVIGHVLSHAPSFLLALGPARDAFLATL